MHNSPKIFAIYPKDDHGIITRERIKGAVENYDYICVDEIEQSNIWLGHSRLGSFCQKESNDILEVLLLGGLYQVDHSVATGEKDTSIIIKLFEKYGYETFNRLNGTFIVILFDKRKKEIVVARDKMGTMPIYYSIAQDSIVVSSEIKIILNFTKYRRVNKKCVSEYLLFRYVTGGNTLFDGICELMPGSYAVVSGSTLIEKKYYNCILAENNCALDEKTAIEQLDHLLTECTIDRLDKYKDVSILLSGGLDSSYLAHKIRGATSGGVKSFTVGFNKKEYNEIKYADWVNSKYKFLRTNHYISEQEYFDNYIESIYIHEEPINHPSTVSLNIISRIAYNKGTRSFISGEGADSVLGSSANIFLLRISQLNKPLKYIISQIIKKSPDLLKPKLFKLKQSKILSTLEVDENFFPVLSSAYGDVEWLIKIMQDGFDYSCLIPRADIYKRHSGTSLINGYLGLAQETSLISSLKMFNKISLANNILLQTPFMDNRIVSFLNNISTDFKFRGTTGKYLFKKICEQIFPKDFIYRPKYGFGVPLEDWLLNKRLLGKYVSLLLEKKTLDREFYNKKLLRKLIERYQSRGMPDASYEGLLWTLLNFEMWIRIFIEEDCDGLAEY